MKVNGIITLMDDDAYTKMSQKTVNSCVPNLIAFLSHTSVFLLINIHARDFCHCRLQC